MSKSESKEQKPEKQRRFDPELLKQGYRCDLDQYEMLKRCSDQKDMTEWNEWRENHPDKDILLEGADFSRLYLENAYLYCSKTHNPFEKPYLDGEVCLKEAKFYKAHLNNTRLDYAHLEGSSFYLANLKGTDLGHAWLQGANLKLAIVDSSTIFWGMQSKNYKPEQVIKTIDRSTILTGVPLDGVRIDPRTKQLLEYNIRRKNWEDWYEKHPRLKWLVKPFWLISDYGLSTGRIIVTFFALAFVFATIYYNWGRIAPPGIVENLFIDKNGVEVQWWLVPLRTLYFSIVTMTTLGFGDMYANAHSIWGHILLSIQVLLGYVLLGALITRFAVLFTAGGPAGDFADDKKLLP